MRVFFQSLKVAPVVVSKAKDLRPYMKVKILDREHEALLDSGASVSCMSLELFEECFAGNYGLCKDAVYVDTADGSRQRAIGSLYMPVCVDGVTRPTKFIVVRNLQPTLILGINFWIAFDVAPGLFKNVTVSSDNDSSVNLVSALSSPADLTESQRAELDKVIEEFRSVSYEVKGLGRCNLIKAKINTEGPPIKQRYYPLSPAKQQLMEAELDEMLRLGVVRPSSSPWASPVVMVTKKDGKPRFCLDSRKLNEVTVRDAYPLPNIQSILQNLNGARYISSIDLAKSYWQLEMEEESCEKTAFVVPNRGLFEFCVLPFGARNSGAILQRVVDALFAHGHDKSIFVYVDDLIIMSPDFETHISLLKLVVQKLREANLTINLKKSEFCKSQLKYLGYVVDKDGLRTDPEKISCVVEFPTPRSSKDVRSFVGLCSYFKKFVRDFSTLSAPLTRLTGTRKGVSNFRWDEEAESAFNALKRALVTAPVLANPDFSLPFTIHADASGVGVGSMLTQTVDGREHVIAYYSRTLTQCQRNYAITEKELLSVLLALRHFRPYVELSHFKVITDHQSLKWLASLKNPTGRLARWSTELLQYSFDVEHRKGKEHVVPDVLSRVEWDGVRPCVGALNEASADAWYDRIFQGCQASPQQFPNFSVKEGRLFRYTKPANELVECNAWKQVIPEAEREGVISKYHGPPHACHLGVHKTYGRLKTYFYWPNMFGSVRAYVAKCEICRAYKYSQAPRAGLMKNPRVVASPAFVYSVDVVGPLPASSNGFCYVFSVVDIFTKYLWLFPLRRATADAVVGNLERLFLQFGTPSKVLTDNGVQFRSNAFKGLLDKYGVSELVYTALYTPHENPVERYNKTFLPCVAALVEQDQRRWCEVLPAVCSAINNTVNISTGYTPYFLMFGREQIIDGGLHNRFGDGGTGDEDAVGDRREYATKLGSLARVYEEVQKNLLGAFKRAQRYYNKGKKDVAFRVGDTVYRRNFALSKGSSYFSNKLAPKFVKGTVTRVVSPVIYEVTDEEGRSSANFHTKDLFRL